MAIVSDVEIRLRADIARLQSDMTSARRTVESATNSMSKAVEQVKSAFVGLAAAFSITEISKQLIDAQREFDKLNSALITATGSVDNAKQAFAALQKFAASTPYDLKQTTEAFLKLRNLGLTPSERALRSYGNTAGALGKSLEQMVEAVADATTGEFERLKEFGIKAKQNGDQVSLTFQGVTKTIANNAATIEKYLLELGETKFAGGMELQAKTLDGAISNLGDTWQATLRTINETGFGDAIKTVVLGLSDALTNLQYILRAVGGEAKKTGEDMESVSTISKVLTTVFETVAVVGANVWYVLQQTGKELGGLAAQAVAVLKGDFAGAAAIGKMMKEDAAAARAALDVQVKAILSTSAAREQAEFEAKKIHGDQLERYGTGTKAQQQATQTALDFYKKTMEASKDTVDALVQDNARLLDGQEELSSEEKNRIKVLNDLAVAGKTLSAQQKADIKGWQDLIVALAKVKTEEQALREARDARIADARQQVQAAEQQSAALEDQIKYYGLTEEAVLKLKAAELSRQLQNEDLDAIERGRLEGLLDETQRQIIAQTQLTKMKADTQFWTSLEDAAHQTFLSIQDGGKDLWTRLKDSAKNIFFEWLYQMTLKKWIINVGLATGGTGAVSGIAGAAQLASGASSAASVTGQLGTLAGLGSLLGSAGGIATGAFQTAGALLSGQIGIGSTLSAGWGALTSGSAAGASAGIASIAGVVAPIAIAALAGSKLLGAAFGMGAKEVRNTSLSGTLTPTGADVNTLQQWFQKGGWFRSDKSGTDVTSVGSAQNSAFASTYKAILDVSKTLGDTIGADTSKLSSRVQQLSIDLTGLSDATAQQEAITKFFAGVSDTIASELVPGLSSFQMEGEALSATLQRVATDYAAVDVALQTIGKSFGAVGVASISARESLIKAAGGLDALASSVSYFQQNFLTEAERLAPVQKQVTDFLASIGQSGLTTIEQYKQFALGIDTTTEAGAKLFAEVLKWAPAFKQVADATTAAAQAAKDLATYNAGLALQRIADAAKLLSGAVDYALDQVSRAVDVQKQVAERAYESLTKAIDANIDAVTARISDLQGLSELLKQRVTVGSAAQSGITRQVAAAAIAAAAQVAQQTGVLPAADAIKDAVSALRADSADNYSSLLDYQRAAARANNDLASLGSVADTQLSVAQTTLQVLQDQRAMAQANYEAEIARLDGVLATAQAQVNLLNGTNTILGTIQETLAQLAVAIKAAQANPVSGAGGATQAAYNQYLGRAATEAEIAFWKEQATKGTDVLGAIANSDEARIQALYQKYLGRTGEQAGVDVWERALANGATWAQIEQGFANSEEAKGRNGAAAGAVAALTEQMTQMQAAMNRTAAATQQLASQFDNASGGGNALVVLDGGKV